MRVVLRQWRDSDREPFAALNADPAVMEHFPSTLTREQSDAFVDRIAAAIEERGWGLWAVEVPGVAPFVGFVGLNVPPFRDDWVEVGWRLAREHWGHGYASEAAREALRHGFEELGLDEIVSFTVPVNVRSRAVMERIGMTRDPARDFDHPNVDVPHLKRHVLYAISRRARSSGSAG
jgi:RimJ/RimL family protein N-acetyltransferase